MFCGRWTTRRQQTAATFPRPRQSHLSRSGDRRGRGFSTTFPRSVLTNRRRSAAGPGSVSHPDLPPSGTASTAAVKPAPQFRSSIWVYRLTQTMDIKRKHEIFKRVTRRCPHGPVRTNRLKRASHCGPWKRPPLSIRHPVSSGQGQLAPGPVHGGRNGPPQIWT